RPAGNRRPAVRGVRRRRPRLGRTHCHRPLRGHDAGRAGQRRARHPPPRKQTASGVSTMNQLFARKSLKVLLDEMAGDHRLRRALGPVTLTALGIGAVIGAGIFVATGEAANAVAGPALMVSYLTAGVTCIFAALCYAEFASMAPVAGSAYTYAYTTMG